MAPGAPPAREHELRTRSYVAQSDTTQNSVHQLLVQHPRFNNGRGYLRFLAQINYKNNAVKREKIIEIFLLTCTIHLQRQALPLMLRKRVTGLRYGAVTMALIALQHSHKPAHIPASNYGEKHCKCRTFLMVASDGRSEWSSLVMAAMRVSKSCDSEGTSSSLSE